jgi:hypothetical protein
MYYEFEEMDPLTTMESGEIMSMLFVISFQLLHLLPAIPPSLPVSTLWDDNETTPLSPSIF